ncbi:MAG TPA: hypothetical protein VD793_06835 [Gemmatimonadales bacterium]|nr:hypothetical protein [Gemmatimonadales bacterium]
MTLTLLLALAASAALTQNAPLPLSVGITGSTPGDERHNPTFMLGFADVQRLMLRMAERPAARSAIDSALSGKPFTLDDMIGVGLLREDRGAYRLDFNLLRLADQRDILETSEQLGRDLAESFLTRRQDLEALAAAHRQPGVGAPELLYIVLGCFALDWDGLALTRDRGYREGAQRTIGGRAFTPWAKETGAEVSLKGLYWGSHNQAGGAFTFTTFGDHHAVPRFGLPDLLWGTRGALARYQGIPGAQQAGGALLSTYASDALDDVARIMAFLRTRDGSRQDLAEHTGLEDAKLDAVLNVLHAADYVALERGLYRARAVVLTPDDSTMVRALRAEARRIMEDWHTRNYPTIRARLSHLTPVTNGVPFERVYTEVWHFVFGIANRTLVERGFFANPYANGRRHVGFMPAIWANGLAQSP